MHFLSFAIGFLLYLVPNYLLYIFFYRLGVTRVFYWVVLRYLVLLSGLICAVMAGYSLLFLSFGMFVMMGLQFFIIFILG